MLKARDREVHTAVTPGADAAVGMPTIARYTLLAFLFLAFAFSYLDRQVLSILLIPIRAEFQLSDGMAGLLMGTAFGLLYTISGIPLSSIADRSNRRNLLAAAFALWSIFTALCGIVQTSWHLMLLRFGIGAAEGGAEPASASMVADAFPPRQRSTALAVQKVGGLLGVAFGLPLAAWIAQTYGWRNAFIALGLPGILLSIVFFLVAKEPPRPAVDDNAANQPVPTLLEALKGLWQLKELRYFYLAVGANSAVTSIMQWIPTLYQRSFGLSLTQIGEVMMWVAGLGASAGMVLGAIVVDRFGRQSDVWGLRFLGILVLTASPLGLVALLVSDRLISTVVLGIWLFITGGWVGPAYALSQTLVRTRIRARSVAILGAFINLVGQGGGPALAGFISQYVSPYTNNSLRYGMIAVMSMGFLASACYFAAARTKQRHS